MYNSQTMLQKMEARYASEYKKKIVIVRKCNINFILIEIESCNCEMNATVLGQ